MLTFIVFVIGIALGVFALGYIILDRAKKGSVAVITYRKPKDGKPGKFSILGQIATLHSRMEAAKQQQRAGNALADEVEYL